MYFIIIYGIPQEPRNATVLCTWIYLHLSGRTDRIRIRACGLQRLEIETPSAPLDGSTTKIFPDLHLADPDFVTPRGIDLVLGADAYSRIILPGVHCREGLVAQKTVFGWTNTGETTGRTAGRPVINCASTITDVQEPWHEILIGLLR